MNCSFDHDDDDLIASMLARRIVARFPQLKEHYEHLEPVWDPEPKDHYREETREE